MLFSITDKFFPTITGDGKSTILELILKDKKARYRAPIYIEQCKLPLSHVLQKGEKFFLTRLGNHSKGADFYSDETLLTTPLVNKIEELFADVKGVDFGRLDIKYRSRESLQRGEFKVLELNGAGAESTNIHDSKFSLWEVYKILFKQWDLLFQLGRDHEKSFFYSTRKLFRSL